MEEPISKNNFCSTLRRRHQELQLTREVTQVSRILKFPNAANQELSLKPYFDLNEIPSVPVFHGRGDILSQLERWAIRGNNRLIGIFGSAGIGKTALVAKCVKLLSGAFEGLIWRSLRDTPDFDDFLVGLIQQLPENEVHLPKTSHEKVSLLIQHLINNRYLIVIDDWSAILHPEVLAGRYRESYENYGLFLRRLGECQHQSTVVVVSREKPGGVAFRDNLGFPVRSLYLQELTQEESQQSLTSFGIVEPTEAYQELFNRYGGNPYFLRIIAKTIVDLFNGDLSSFLAQKTLIYGDIRGLLHQQFKRLTKLERVLVKEIANSSESMTLADFSENVISVNNCAHILETLESLYHRGFLHQNGLYFNLPPLFRQYSVNFLCDEASDD